MEQKQPDNGQDKKNDFYWTESQAEKALEDQQDQLTESQLT